MNKTATTTLVIAAALVVCARASAADKTNSAPARPLAMFVDDSTKGKDPFFPESTRRLVPVSQPQQLANTNSSTPVIAQALPLSLKGISGTKGQLLAIVNNATLAVGEAADVRCNGQAMKILLREIRERSVLIEIVATGEIKELKLRDGI